MTYVRDWYDSGRVADSYSWDETIKPGSGKDVLNYERDWALAGCSGYVTYKIFDTEITIAFSNPSVGTNKLGVGTGGQAVWDNMTDHDYNPFTEYVDACNEKVLLKVKCNCTSGTTNTCTVDITAYKR